MSYGRSVGYPAGERVDDRNVAELRSDYGLHATPPSGSVEKFQSTSSSSSSQLRSPWQRMGIRVRMICLLLAGAIVMFSHHSFYNFLDGQQVLVGNSEVGRIVQKFYTALGSFFALVAKLFLSLAVGESFAQVFWLYLRSKRLTIAQIDSAMGTKDSPFTLGALLSWRYLFWLTVLPAIATLNAQIIVFSSGAVEIDFAPAPAICNVTTVNLSRSDIGVLTSNSTATSFGFLSPASQTRAFVSQVIMSARNFDPLLLYDSQVASLEYNVTFNAPALNCTDVGALTDFASVLPPQAAERAPVVVWRGEYSAGSGNLVLNIAARELAVSPTDVNNVTSGSRQEAMSCTMFNATYFVGVQRTLQGGVLVDAINITFNDPLSNTTTDNIEDIQMNAIADSFARLMNGTGIYDPGVFDFTPESPLIVYSPVGGADRNNPWSWRDNMINVLPSLMSNVSESLLSGDLSISSAPTLQEIETDCQAISLFFVYNRDRLLFSYGAGLIVTSLCIAVGFIAIAKNGVEETLDFSRILRSVVNENLLTIKGSINSRTTVEAKKDGSAELRPALLSR